MEVGIWSGDEINGMQASGYHVKRCISIAQCRSNLFLTHTVKQEIDVALKSCSLMPIMFN
jgi:alpha-acetolactate decarboxylase